MKFATFMSILLVLALSRTMPAQSRGVSEKYSILMERSIFSRTPVRFSSAPSPTTRPSLRPGQLLVLTGIMRVNNDSGFAAMIEDTSVEKSRRIRPGDKVGTGSVTQISLDSIEYQIDGKKLQIKVGQNMEGADAEMSSLAGAAPTTAPATGGQSAVAAQPAPSDGGGSGDVLERMRQRRLQEMKQK